MESRFTILVIFMLENLKITNLMDLANFNIKMEIIMKVPEKMIKKMVINLNFFNFVFYLKIKYFKGSGKMCW